MQNDARFFYRVTETNVDGFGGEATEFVSFNKELDDKDYDEFQTALNRAKDKDLDTSDMIELALGFFGKYDGEICVAPYVGAFEF